MKAPAPLRNYKQMVRVVRDSSGAKSHSPYQLANAYSSERCNPTETRERTLDENGINGRTSRRPEASGAGNYLSRRESTTQFHELSRDQQSYFTGSHDNPAPTRQDGWDGTKSRTYLGGSAPSEQVVIHPPSRGGGEHSTGKSGGSSTGGTGGSEQTSQRTATGEQSRQGEPQHNNPIEINPANMPPPAGKQTRLPIVKAPSLKGMQGIGLEI